MKLEEILKHYEAEDDCERVTLGLAIKAVNKDEQIVYGEVYAPNIIDTHGDMMLPEDVKLLAHRFMARALNGKIDVMHDNKVIDAVAVESWVVNRDDDPVYNPGAWVLGTKINDKKVWKDVKAGKYGGYSMQALVRKQPAIVEVSYFPSVYLYTEQYSGHDHAALVQIDENGRVVGGVTSKAADGHFHVIKYGTATETASKHRHRFFLP